MRRKEKKKAEVQFRIPTSGSLHTGSGSSATGICFRPRLFATEPTTKRFAYLLINLHHMQGICSVKDFNQPILVLLSLGKA